MKDGSIIYQSSMYDLVVTVCFDPDGNMSKHLFTCSFNDGFKNVTSFIGWKGIEIHDNSH